MIERANIYTGSFWGPWHAASHESVKADKVDHDTGDSWATVVIIARGLPEPEEWDGTLRVGSRYFQVLTVIAGDRLYLVREVPGPEHLMPWRKSYDRRASPGG